MEQVTNITSKKLAEISNDLGLESRKMNRNGKIAIGTTLIFTIGFFIFMYIMTIRIFSEINEMHKYILSVNPDHNFDDLASLIFFLAIRTIVFGVVGFLIILFMLKLARSCFDQSARFTKRKHSTEFLDYISDKDKDLKDQMEAFFIWNLTIESAFTHGEKNSSKTFNIPKIFGAEANNETVTAKAKI